MYDVLLMQFPEDFARRILYVNYINLKATLRAKHVEAAGIFPAREIDEIENMTPSVTGSRGRLFS